MGDSERMTLVLGGEADAALRQAVLWALNKLGAKRDGADPDTGRADFLIGGERVVMEAQVAVGLSLSGPAVLVEHLARLTDERLGT